MVRDGEVGDTMEIGTYVRVLGWRAVVAVLVIAVAVAGPMLVVLRDPTVFKATAAVRISEIAAEPEGGAGADEEGSRLAADLAAILRQPSTLRVLATESGLDPKALEARLSVARTGSRQYVDVTFTDRSRRRARQVAQNAARTALTILYEERLLVARLTLKEAELRLESARAASSGPSPLAAYQRARNDQARLEQLVAERSAVGDAAGARAAVAPLEAARSEATAAATQLHRLEQAAAEETVAQEAVDRARALLIPAEEQARALGERTAVSNGPIRQERPTKRLAGVGIVGAVVGTALVFSYLVVTEVRSALRRRRTTTPTTAAQPAG